MIDTIALANFDASERKSHGLKERLFQIVIWQVIAVSLAAYASQLLIFDEANWYRIDMYDALVWGLVVTQVFTVAVYTSHFRIESVKTSLRVFGCLGMLAVGLTLAAISFLSADAWRREQPVLPILGISGGYCVAVFVFLVSMFLQLRLAIICLKTFRHAVRQPGQSTLTTGDEVARPHYSMADIFALTGLAAVSISAYHMFLGMVTDRDAMRFVTLFYAASCMALFVFGLNQVRCPHYLGIGLITAACLALSFSEFYVAEQLRSPFLRFGFSGILLWNGTVALATYLQLRWQLFQLV